MYLIPVPILSTIALALCVLRIWTRVTRTRRMYIDDWLIAVAMVLSLVNTGLASGAFAYGWGHIYVTLAPANIVKVLKLLFGVQTTWVVSICLIRVSVACSLLRFGQELFWRAPLFFIIGFQILVSCSYIVIQFAQCRPVSANWEQVPDVKCWPTQPIVDYGWAIAAVYVSMDLVLAMMPIRLIRMLTRPPAEKVLIGILMATGLLATSMACAKMTTFPNFGKGDPMQATVAPSTYAKLEEIVGIIASSLPALKQPVEKLLKRYNLFDTRFHNTRPSFVGDQPVSLPQMPREQDQRSSGEASSQGVKDKIRIDSVSVLPGSSSSKLDGRKEGFQAL
ncbi:hypothetical protein BDV96DRAFT_498380 [Lophiotrema nucula]|uniref:Rhodopsin domain-containing protein n=1 Tax=Lophiotrema nucula TaxID=690887 RepID=A0A6A5YZD9_9PLEO|nr:hypothetical protein BDV96DRAFT_498380 [Lophiotrema nucula]